MIVLFLGGGPAQGLMKTMNTKGEVIRVATQEMLSEGKAAFYSVGEKHPMISSHSSAVATYSGMRDSTAALVDLVIP